MSVSAGSCTMSARPPSALSAVRHASSTRITSSTVARTAASWSAALAAATSASNAALSRTGGSSVDDVGEHGGATVGEQLGHRGVGRAGEAELLGVREAVDSRAVGSGTASSSSRRTPSRCRAAASSADPSTASATVAPSSTSAGCAVTSWPARRWVMAAVDGAEDPGGLAGAGQPAVAGDLGHRLGELRPQRRLERLEVLAARLLGAGVVDDAVGGPQVLGDPRPVPGLARHEDAGRRAAPALERVEQRLLPRRHRAQEFAARSGAGTSETRRFFGRLRIRLVTSSSRRPGTFHEKSSSPTWLRVATGTSIVSPSSSEPGLEVVADREGQALACCPASCSGSRPRRPRRRRRG